MIEQHILKKMSLPSESDFLVVFNKDMKKNLLDNKNYTQLLSQESYNKMSYLFDHSLSITQEYKTDDICKKIENVHHIINIYLPPITKIQYSSKDIAKLHFFKKFKLKKQKALNNLTIIQLFKLLLKIAPKSSIYLIYKKLDISYLYLLHHLFETVYFDYSTIDNNYHIYCKNMITLNLFDQYKVSDLISVAGCKISFSPELELNSGFCNRVNKVQQFYKGYYEYINKKVVELERERVINQKGFSISVSKEVKNSLIRGVRMVKQLGLPLAELYLNFDEKNCMIYRLNRFFPFYKEINNSNFFITEEGLYSVSRPKEADIISKRIKQSLPNDLNPWELLIADMTANVGGNVLNFCKYFKHVYAIELQWLNYLILRNNVHVAKYDDKCTIINGDCMEYAGKYDFDVLFFDPPWGGVNYKERKSVDLYLGDKSMVDIVIDLLANGKSKLIAIKVPYNYNFDGFDRANIHYVIYKINNILLVII